MPLSGFKTGDTPACFILRKRVRAGSGHRLLPVHCKHFSYCRLTVCSPRQVLVEKSTASQNSGLMLKFEDVALLSSDVLVGLSSKSESVLRLMNSE